MSLSGLPAIGPTLVSARSFEEYLAMFNLDDADLTGRVLDCPGGAASFAAEAGARGVDVLAVDPVYAADHTWLGEHGKSEALRGNRHTASCLDAFSWTFFTTSMTTGVDACRLRASSPTTWHSVRSATWPPRCRSCRWLIAASTWC